MSVFFIRVTVLGLTFEKAVLGPESDYTKEQIKEIRERFKKNIKLKLIGMGYVE